MRNPNRRPRPSSSTPLWAEVQNPQFLPGFCPCGVRHGDTPPEVFPSQDDRDISRRRVELRRRIRRWASEKGHPLPNVRGWTLDELDSFAVMIGA